LLGDYLQLGVFGPECAVELFALQPGGLELLFKSSFVVSAELGILLLARFLRLEELPELLGVFF
jgi:hypothetical protein